MQMLKIQLFGAFRMEYGGERITTVNMARLQSLLAYLLVHRQAPQSRQHVAFRFWPDSSEKQAHTNLRKLLFQLRLAEVALHQGELVQAQEWVEQILIYLQTYQLDLTDEELYIYMSSYRVLREGKDPRATHLLHRAYEQLHQRAATLTDDGERQLFWAAPPHAAVLAEMKQG